MGGFCIKDGGLWWVLHGILCANLGVGAGGGLQKSPRAGAFGGMTMGYLRRSAAAPSKAMSAAAVAVLTKSFAPVVGLLVVVLGVSSVGT